LLDHRRVESSARHHGEALAVEPANVELPTLSPKPNRASRLDVLWDPEVRCQKVRSPGGDDRERRLRPGKRIDRTLRRAIAAPDEEQFGALVQDALHLLHREAALRDFDPQRIVHPLAPELAPELRQAAAERLTGMRDDRAPCPFDELPCLE